MMRTMHAKVFVALAALSLVGSTCTNRGASDPPVQDPRARLDALGERWMTTVATITYRTTQRDPGEATSPHQCLRQLVGEREFDVQTGLRTCSGVGEVRLAWKRSDRWRMDEDSADAISTSVFGPDEYVRCRFDGAASGCVAVEKPGRFASLVEAPAKTLDELETATVTAEGPRTIAGMRAECFHATGGSADAVRRVGWCFTRDGLLLSLFDGVQDGRVTSAEATHVSPGVSASDFVTPTK
jgi:hypothetical protein